MYPKIQTNVYYTTCPDIKVILKLGDVAILYYIYSLQLYYEYIIHYINYHKNTETFALF